MRTGGSGSSNGSSTSGGILQNFLQLPPAGFSNGQMAGAAPRGGRMGSGYATVQQAAMAAAAAAAACSAVAPAAQGPGSASGAGGMGSQVGSLEYPGPAAGSGVEMMDSEGIVQCGSCSGVSQATSARMLAAGRATPSMQSLPLAGTKRPLAAAEGPSLSRCDSMPLRHPAGAAAAAGAPAAARGTKPRGAWLRQALSDMTALMTPDTWCWGDAGVADQHLGASMVIKTATSDVVSWGQA